ncbi:MAG: L-2-amino-thiazoline-4-carboxylic acid hydrolase [Anaerolineae bacterium]|jgi:hypothetical protein|nr:L-2-amino-thiazoline-4-carboxylic acid hydrolase [Anaerolineae bacterium]MBT7071726.1 L-2-amino-thiazoline-4-carboxylic acid hydrolase [Anaerolineae bacterium]MBT7323523.1 L-2-amino-thiazoline-4-carboxylic acid hydrolase [Anaerolineae bacterium]
MNQKAMQRALHIFFTAEEAQTVNADVILRIRKIDSEREKYAQKALEKHFGENILPTLALYLVLKEKDAEGALVLTEKITNEMYDIGRKWMAFFGRFPFFYWLIQKMTPGMMKRIFPPEGWDVEWLEGSKKQVAFNMHTCFYLNSLTEYNAAELTPIFCGLDDLIYDEVSPHLLWKRTGTLGHGDTYCDFRFINPKQE